MGRLQQGLNKYFFQVGVIRYRKKYALPPITIISSDCSGGVLLHDYGLPLDTPTVNLIIEGTDFVKLCSNLDHYMNTPLALKEHTAPYPIALCDDITIKGIHYHSFSELNDAWTRRKERIHRDNIVYLLSACQISDRNMLEQFLALPGRKIVFCPQNYSLILDNNNFVPLRKFEQMFMFSGLSGHRNIDKDFNFAQWYLNSRKEK